MSADFAIPVKNIINTWGRGLKLAKKIGKSATAASDGDTVEFLESIERLQSALERDCEAVTVEYKRCLEQCGEPFAKALVEDKFVQSHLRDLRSDLTNQIFEIQVVVEPEDFEEDIFNGAETESGRISKECIKVFETVRETLEKDRGRSSSPQEIVEEVRNPSVGKSRQGSVSTQASNSASTKLRVVTIEQESGPPPIPESSWIIDSPLQPDNGIHQVELQPSTSESSSEEPTQISKSDDPSTFIPTTIVDVRLKANDEFLERRRQSKISFYKDKRISVISIDENRESSFDVVSPISPTIGSPIEGRSTEYRSSRGSSDYTAFVQGQRGSTSEKKRTSIASSLRTSSTAPAESKPSNSRPVSDEIFEISSPSSEEAASNSGFAISATLKLPGYGTGVEDGLEAVNTARPDYDNEKILVTNSNTKPQTPTSSVKSNDSPMRHDSSFYKFGGFCEGARATLRGELGYKIAKKPTGTYGSVDYAKCIKCSFEISVSQIEKDARMDISGIYGSHNIRWRQQFLTKCHVRTSAAEDPLYACIFCIEDRKTPEEHDATIFFSSSQLFAHLARHPQPLPNVNGITALYGKIPVATTNFDLHFMSDQPTPSKYNLTEIAPEVAVRPSANALTTYHPKSSRSSKDPDGNPTLHFAAGARILGIKFPDHLGGAWCVGYHDGEKGSFPSAAISLDLPSREDVFMSPQSSLVAFARWEFKPKEAKEGGWLRFSKGDRITNIGYTFQDQWCWSGQTKNGKWGLFPATFVDALQDGNTVGSAGGKSGGLLGLKKLGRSSGSFSVVRSSVRSPSVRSGSSGKVPTVKSQPGLEVVVNGVVL